MPRKIITYLVFFAFLNLVGCYSYQAVTYEEFENTNPDDIKSEDIYIITRDSTKYHSSWWTFSVNEDSVFIKGSKFISEEQQAPFKGKISVSEIESIEVDKFDGTKTTIFVIGSTAAFIALIALASSGESSGGGCSEQIEIPEIKWYNYNY